MASEIVLSADRQGSQTHYAIQERNGAKHLFSYHEDDSWPIKSKAHLIEMLRNDVQRGLIGAEQALKKARTLSPSLFESLESPLESDIETRRNPYGFGHNWTLVIKNAETGERVKDFALGQDAKVFQRLMGIPHRQAWGYYIDKAGLTKDEATWEQLKPYVKADLLKALANMPIDAPLPEEKEQEILQAMVGEAAPWQFHAGGG